MAFSFDIGSRSRSHGLVLRLLPMRVLLSLIAGLQLCALTGWAEQPETRFFEMRTYYAAPGKLDDLLARFRNHTLKIFENHGIANIGYWLPETNTDNKL